MARLPVFLVALFLLAAMTSACDDVEFDEDNQRTPPRCRQQIQTQQLRPCEQFLTQRRRGRQILAIEEEIDEDNTTEHLRECCGQLRRLDDQCRCEAVRYIVRRQRQQGRLDRQEVRQMLERARNLPSICRLGRRRCEVGSVRF